MENGKGKGKWEKFDKTVKNAANVPSCISSVSPGAKNTEDAEFVV